MKTISLEIDERVYPQVVDFLRSLPEDCCHVLEDEDSLLSVEEIDAIQAMQIRLQRGDDKDFVDWEDVKDKL